MKDIFIGIFMGVVSVLMVLYFVELKRLDRVKSDKQHITTVEVKL